MRFNLYRDLYVMYTLWDITCIFHEHEFFLYETWHVNHTHCTPLDNILGFYSEFVLSHVESLIQHLWNITYSVQEHGLTIRYMGFSLKGLYSKWCLLTSFSLEWSKYRSLHAPANIAKEYHGYMFTINFSDAILTWNIDFILLTWFILVACRMYSLLKRTALRFETGVSKLTPGSLGDALYPQHNRVNCNI